MLSHQLINLKTLALAALDRALLRLSYFNMEREKFTLETEEAQLIPYGDHENFETVLKEVTGTSRWSTHYRIVVKRLKDGLLFESDYSQGSTESQDESPYEYSDAVFNQVFPVEKTITVYE